MNVVRCPARLLALLAVCALAPELSWGQLVKFPISVAVDRDGNVYVSEYDQHRIDKLDTSGNVVWRSGTLGSANDQFHGPNGIAVDSLGFIYVADTYNARVQKLNPNGVAVGRWGTSGSAPGQFRRPVAIAVDSRDAVYVLDAELRRVQKFSNDGGVFYGAFGAPGTADGQLSPVGGGPHDIVIDSADNAYVADTSGNRIHKWHITSDAAGNIIDATFLGWSGRCVSGGNCDLDNQRSQAFTCTATTCSAPSSGYFVGQFVNPMGLGLDSQGSLLVADFDNNRVQTFDRNGNFLRTWGQTGSHLLGFRGPLDVAAYTTAAVYVADMRNNRIVKLSNTGTPLSVVGGDIQVGIDPAYPSINRDALVDPDPLFLLPNQRRTLTLTAYSSGSFSGRVWLRDQSSQTQPAVYILTDQNWLDVPADSSAATTLRISTGISPTPGKFLAVIGAENQQLGVARQIPVAYEVIKALPEDTAAPCPGWYQRGLTPEVLPLSDAMGIFDWKAAHPEQTVWVIAVAARTHRVGWQLTIEKATGLTPPLRPDETLVVVENPTPSLKAVLAMDGRTCGLAPTHGVGLDAGTSGEMRISAGDTTTLVFSRQGQDYAVFSQPNFWSFFGGRKLTIRWLE
jgi:DNA-binding beta-propeller fold protein YncE